LQFGPLLVFDCSIYKQRHEKRSVMKIDQLPGVRRPKSFLASSIVFNVFDIVIAGCALIVFAPVMLAIMAAVWYDSGRPIFFSQVRLGRHGRLFRIYKFRKFAPDAGTSGCGVTVQDDPRLTRLGAFLERTKLDELPQLWNVLIGDMAVVGPRPESTNFADCFTGTYRHVLDYKPGIFGPCQVLFRNEGALYPKDSDPEKYYRDVLFKQKARIDLDYFVRRTLWSDIRCLAQGVIGVLNFKSGTPPVDAREDASEPLSWQFAFGADANPADGVMPVTSIVRRGSRRRVHAGLAGASKRSRALRGSKSMASMVKQPMAAQSSGAASGMPPGTADSNGIGATLGRGAASMSAGIAEKLQKRLIEMDLMIKRIESQLAVKDKQIMELTDSHRDMQLMMRTEFKYVFPLPADRHPIHADIAPHPLKSSDDVVLPHDASR
jgi:lipopolysaccharide/colanic/teichoic acid biosynthesis glycosyltransferase